eukprot:m.206677 g.206677  ORF g.206677 m.206677 type:complete len:234 (-) comp23441_c0_seq1:109-810(-)
MRPDAHKQARSRQYQKANPAAASVAAHRRTQRKGAASAPEEPLDHASTPPHAPHDRQHVADVHHADGHGLPEVDDDVGDEDADQGEDLELLLRQEAQGLTGGHSGASDFRFRAEQEMDPVTLLGQAGFVGATDALAAPRTPGSVLWPPVSGLADGLTGTPLHCILGVDPSDLVDSVAHISAHDGADSTAALKSGEGSISVGEGRVPDITKTGAAVGADEGDEEGLEDWLDSVL